jgi:hypothetical protein
MTKPKENTNTQGKHKGLFVILKKKPQIFPKIHLK